MLGKDAGGRETFLRADNKRLKSEISRHKEQLEALKERDPEFYAYLQQADSELLKFGVDEDKLSDDDVDVGVLEAAEQEEEDEDGEEQNASPPGAQEDQQLERQGATHETGEEQCHSERQVC